MDEGETEAPGHPPAHRLDAIAAGDLDSTASVHLESCEACTRYVDQLRAGSARFRAENDARAFVARVEARRPTRHARSAALRAAGAVVPIAAAAALLLLWVRARPQDGALPPPPTTEPAGPAGEPREARFKGGLVVVVVREREGIQQRFSGPLQVRAGDRLRVEVSTDHDGALTAGLLTDEGEWVQLLASSTLEAGTHYSELAARFDDSPTHATLVVGDPAAVDRARRMRDFGGVVAWRVTSQAGP
jgi:hypothetical protein